MLNGNTKDLIFYDGSRGMLQDSYSIKNERGELIREDLGEGEVRWTERHVDAHGNETITPVPAGIELRILELKRKGQDPAPAMFTECTHSAEGLAHKKYPFSWEASQ